MNIHKPDLTDFASFSAQMGDWIAAKHTWGVGSRVQAEGRWGTIVRREAHYPSKEWDDSEYTLVLFDGEPEPVVTYLGDLVGEPPSPIQYLDLTGQWERFGEWERWLGEKTEPWTKYYGGFWTPGNECVDIAVEAGGLKPKPSSIKWPPRNPILLGWASTQEEVKHWLCRHIPEHSRYMDLTGWREALLLEPVEELDIRFDAIARVEQIIVRPPQYPVHCDECGGTGHYTHAEDPCLVCDAKGKIPLERLLRTYPKHRDSIIRQVREIRGECGRCCGNGEESILRNNEWRFDKGGCPDCQGSGLIPGKPLLLIEE